MDDVVQPTDAILHAFDWPYTEVAKCAKTIAQLGFASVLVSPPMRSEHTSDGTPWWQRYQPQDYRLIDNQLGNTDDFVAMTHALAKENLRLYVDVVFNHMANESSLRDDLQYPSESLLKQYRNNEAQTSQWRLFGDLSLPLFEQGDFERPFAIKNWRNRTQVQKGRISGGQSDPGLPTLKPTPRVIEAQRAYIKAIKQLGAVGFRIDAAKHLSLEHLKAVWDKELCQDCHVFGEIITDGGATQQEYELFLAPYLADTALDAYDFPLFHTLRSALSSEGDLQTLIDPYCFGQALSPQRAVTFIITHDIPNNDVFLPLLVDETSEWLGYAYLLCRDGGVPLIYAEHRLSGIEDSDVHLRWQTLWQSAQMSSLLSFHNHMHGFEMRIDSAQKELLIFTRYHPDLGPKGWVVINKAPHSISVSLPDWLGEQARCLWPEDCAQGLSQRQLTVAEKSYSLWVLD
ncbi:MULTISPECIES: alpha-amylase family protein [unclassified Vibrio]|uniref:Alpha-amylase n=1 Tax=Vibrio sp. HB236076 TaxID=3232307 RepID=A0AB39HLH2_9VIBR|nr:alpha-amylase family protein [Vibrio sp. HB161653]MDP5252662.1 alpha-amylase family protein [Vibrio sp. HB161653]